MPSIRREQLAAMGCHYRYCTLEQMLDAQAAAGFKTLEFLAIAPQYHLDERCYQSPDEARKMAEDRGLHIGCFTPECAGYQYLMCAPEDGVFHDLSMEYFKRGLECGSKLGAKMLLTNCIGGAWDEEYERVFDRAVRSLTELGKVAEGYGITIAVETVRPEESKVIIKLPELVRLLKAVDSPNVKGGLDTTAMGVANETPREWFAALGKDLVHMHFIDGKPYKHLVWGDGLYPLEDYLQVINDNHFEGYLTQEITDSRYWDNPGLADKRAMDAFRPYIID
ncbi:MAG: TIM barrel protein [Eubacteriales bacterium]|nr:TIM barrel protein [Eubacteriales bacterium]